MKKIIGVILAVALLGSGCSSGGADSAAEGKVIEKMDSAVKKEESEAEVTAEAAAGAEGETEAADYEGLNEYIGRWEDQYSLRCTMEISSASEKQVSIVINWSSGATEDWEWKMTGTFQPASKTVEYGDCVYTKYTYMDGGDVSSQVIYADGAGKIEIKGDGYLYWEDGMENRGEQCYFAKIDSSEAAAGAEASNPYSDSILLWKSYDSPLTGEDCAGLSKEELRIARNEIYAAYGRIFSSQDLAAYFNSKSWYHGTVPAEQFNDSLLTDIQKDNIELIQLYEDLAGQEDVTYGQTAPGNDYWDDGTGLEGVLHKTTDPWGYPWSDYKYTDYETLYRTNGRNEEKQSYKTVMSGYIEQVAKDTFVIVTNYNSSDDYTQASLYTNNAPAPQRVIVKLQNDYTIPYGTMYMEDDVVTIYGATVGNVERSGPFKSFLIPEVLACDIILEDGTFSVQSLNEMHAQDEWEKTLQ